ncbi:hypothetical protein SAMN05444682_110128 [Parapedobacter indicus]|uniref:Uncharacterized protein n=1 Tax=Parapedobacter indicus TaxID=1477437 RepID=A0A1I3RW85_9SPHI|nr:hypothetical protein CLV26_110117 [Parapedobacter indicus]SFJ49659.1 hypothetical protein SAMN05444682_110128 [Parapedobacter indicus]
MLLYNSQLTDEFVGRKTGMAAVLKSLMFLVTMRIGT